MHDIIVVGGRCAGAAVGMLLARRGYRVLMIDKDPRNVEMKHSTHFVQALGVAKLKQWGLLPELEAACRGFEIYDFDFGAVRIQGRPPAVDGDARAFGPRRYVLDPILVGAAEAAGVQYRSATEVTALLRDGERVTGVVTRDVNGARLELPARIVIGADGPGSTVAKLVNAAHYHEAPAQQVTMWGYWGGIDSDRLSFSTRPGLGLYWGPTLTDQVLVGVNWVMASYKSLDGNQEAAYHACIADLDPILAERLRDAELTEPLRLGSTRNFLRVPHGPGWVLVGDAGHKKDPCTAQGISDAFIDADECAAVIDRGLRGEVDLDAELRAWHQARDARLVPLHQMTIQLANFPALSDEETALYHAIAADPEATTAFLGLLSGATRPEVFFAPENLARLMGAREHQRIGARTNAPE